MQAPLFLSIHIFGALVKQSKLRLECLHKTIKQPLSFRQLSKEKSTSVTFGAVSKQGSIKPLLHYVNNYYKSKATRKCFERQRIKSNADKLVNLHYSQFCDPDARKHTV